MVLDLFAGPGGWSQGLRALGIHDELGIEWGTDECATRAAAGHATIRADVAALDPQHEQFAGTVGLIASPPCPAFSAAGKREGMADMNRLMVHAAACADGWFPAEGPWEHPESPLVLEPLRWAAALQPEWIACEQVPPVLPAWKVTAHALEAWGYSTWVGLLNAADYGVPQTRRRAILMAHRSKRVVAPAPTHTKNPAPSLFGLPRWVTMAEALGWGMTAKPSGPVTAGASRTGAHDPLDGGSNQRAMMQREYDEGRWEGEPWAYLRPIRGKGTTERYGARRDHPGDEPAPTITARMKDTYRLIGHQGNPDEGYQETQASEPAPTFTAGARLWKVEGPADERAWDERSTEEMNEAIADGSWADMRPATTIAGDSRVFAPGGHHEPGEQSRHARHLTIAEAATLQSFPADYPFQGSRTSQFRQVGNAVPPGLAAQILAALVDH